MRIDLDALVERRSAFRWIRDLVQHRVGHWDMSYDEENDLMHLDYTTVRREDVPLEALHVTGKGSTEWATDRIDSGSFPEPGHCTAIDLYCWMNNNALDDALTVRHKTPIDPKLLVYAAVGGLAVLLIMWFYLR